MEIVNIKKLPIKSGGKIKPLWTVHSYYTMNPYAPDGSGRILCAGCDLESGLAEVMIIDRDGYLLDSFGCQRVSAIFFHTGFWQSWGENGKYVYYQSSDGDVRNPKITMRELDSGREYTLDADMEGVPCFGEPYVYGLSGMYYAAGYGDGKYHPDECPVPFNDRKNHGLFMASVKDRKKRLVLSIDDIISIHPLKDKLLEADKDFDGGLTLMVYCARYSRDGRYVMFHFGNHCVDKRRGEPHLSSIFTGQVSKDGNIYDINYALDLNYEKNGVHWSWDNNGGLLGYYKGSPDKKTVLAGIDRDGGNFRVISDFQFTGGHPSVSPRNRSLIVTDGAYNRMGKVLFIENGKPVNEIVLPKFNYEGANGKIPAGRNRYFVCHHPVFNHDGSRILVNTLPGENAELCEIEIN
jgi:hypothetical protein